MAPDISDDDRSEAVDVDRLGDEYPPDAPLASEDYGVTGAEQRYDEPLDERIRREQPDDPSSDVADERTRQVQPIDQGEPDEDEDLVADVVEDPDVRDRSPGDEIAGDETTRDVATERVPPPAEEVAIHVEEEG